MTENSQSHLFGQISVGQLFAIMTCAAGFFVVLASLPFYSSLHFTVLLAPLLIYGMLRAIGMLFLPARWLASHCGLTFSIATLCSLLATAIFGAAWTILFLPIAVFWLLQITGLHLAERMLVKRDTSTSSGRIANVSDRSLLSFGLFLAGSSLVVAMAAQMFHVSGRGTALGSYWMIHSTRNSIVYDCQTGYEDIPLTVIVRRGTAVSGRRGPAWSWLGLKRYRLSPNRGALHVPHWFTLLASMIYPLFFGWKFIESRGGLRRVWGRAS